MDGKIQSVFHATDYHVRNIIGGEDIDEINKCPFKGIHRHTLMRERADCIDLMPRRSGEELRDSGGIRL